MRGAIQIRGEMRPASVCGVVLLCRPEHLGVVAEAVEALAWAEVHYRDPRGRLVVTIEGPDGGTSIGHLEEIRGIPRVLAAELAGVYLDTEQESRDGGHAEAATTPGERAGAGEQRARTLHAGGSDASDPT